MKFKHIAITTIIGILFAAIAAFMLQARNANVMSIIEGQNTFLYTSTFFTTCMSNPAGLLTWCGAYCTQFMNDNTGIYILCAMWIAIIAITAFVMKIPAKWSVLATIPAAMLFASNVGLEYWIFFLKTPGYLFTATLGIIVSLLGGWLVYQLRKWGIGSIIAIALYPFFGIYGLLASILGIIFIAKDTHLDKKHKWINCAATLVALLMPLVWHSTIYHTSMLQSAYTAGLPLFQKVSVTDSEQYVPYTILIISLIILAFISSYLTKSWGNKAITWITASVVVICAEAAYIEHRWYNNDNYECELEMLLNIEKGDWQEVIIADNMYSGEPTRAIVMMRNLALFKLGKLGDAAFTYRNSGILPESAITVSIAHTIAPTIYYHYGKINYCNRWLIEHAVDYGWSANCLKYLIKCAAINGEKEVAEKYARLLQTTRNYKDSEEVRIGLGIAKDSHDMEASKSLMNYNDFVGSDRDLPDLYLLDNFTNDTTSCLKIKNLAMHSLLVQKDMRLFWPHFFHYIDIMGSDNSMPIHFQEAAYLLGKSKGSQINVDELPFDQKVKDTYAAFAAQMAQCAHLPIEVQRQSMSYNFGKTYFYYYYLGKEFTTY